MPDSLPRCQIAVIGGGASGLMAAISAAMTLKEAQPTAQASGVLLLEKQERVGRKLLTTGNGRCNLTNQDMTVEHFHGHAPHFAETILKEFSIEQTLDFFRQIGLPCRTLDNGRVYPYSLQASAVLDVLRQAAQRLGVGTQTDCAVSGLQPAKSPAAGFVVTTQDRRMIADRVIVATGGMAAPGLGCDGSGYALLTRLGHRCTEVFPALVQVRTETDLVRGLAGIKFDGTAVLRVGDRVISSATGEILFAEYGLSGPPLLELSRDVAVALQRTAEPVEIVLDLLPDLSAVDLKNWLIYRRQSDLRLELSEYLTGLIHKKLGQAVLKRCLDRSVTMASPVGSLTDADIDRLTDSLKALAIRAIGTRDWTQAQVTAGGLETEGFYPATLESKLVPGLFAVGEILDIDGDCGGYNLQWAWASGHAAGRSAMLQTLADAGHP